MNDEQRYEREQADRAASEAAHIGGLPARQGSDPARAPVEEAGGGEAEGFEQAEELLVEHATHGDQQSTHAILHDQQPSEEDDFREDGEADREHSSEDDTNGSPPET
jgi:hypothetical protein